MWRMDEELETEGSVPIRPPDNPAGHFLSGMTFIETLAETPTFVGCSVARSKRDVFCLEQGFCLLR